MSLTVTLVGLLLVLSVLLGLAVSWGRQRISDDYFLAGRTLPWYAVALSILGASFGLQYLLGMVGLAYVVGGPSPVSPGKLHRLFGPAGGSSCPSFTANDSTAPPNSSAAGTALQRKGYSPY